MMARQGRTRCLAPALLSVLLVAAADEAAPDRKLVVGGAPFPIAQQPFLVSLWTPDRYLCGDGCKMPAEHECGGSLIAEQWVLTAAHCYRLVDNGVYGTAYFGLQNKSDPASATRVPIEAFIPHPQYERGSANPHDVALVKLASPVSGFRPALLESAASKRTWTLLYLAGWGNVAEAGSPTRYSNAPQLVVVPVVPCGSKEMVRSKICAGTLTQGASFGDSGGPLSGHVRGMPIVVGVVQGPVNVSTQISNFARVSFYRDWITSVLGLPLAEVSAEEAPRGSSLRGGSR